MTFFSPKPVVPLTISNVRVLPLVQPLSIDVESKVIPGTIAATSISMDVMSSPSALRRSRTAARVDEGYGVVRPSSEKVGGRFL